MARPAPTPNLGAMETRIARREAALFVIIQAILGIGAAIVAAAEGVDVRHIEDASSFGQAVAYGAALTPLVAAVVGMEQPGRIGGHVQHIGVGRIEGQIV